MIIVTILFIVILSVLILLNITASAKEDKFISLSIIIVVLIIACFVYMRESNKECSIDLPEEHQLILYNKLKPDTLLGYYRNDTLVIEFKH